VYRAKKRGMKRKQEMLEVSDSLLAHIRGYLAEKAYTSGPLFRSQKGTPLTRRGMQWIFKQAIKKAGLSEDVSIHCARHTYAVELLEQSGNLRLVQKQLGHSSPVTTANMYADVRPAVIRQSVNQMYGG